MPLFKRKLSANNIFLEQALIHEKVSLVSNIDYIDSDSDVNDQNESHFFSVIWSAFYCQKILMTFYITLLCVLGCATIYVTIPVRFRTPEFRLFRAGLFASLGASACFPVLHAIILYGLQLCNDVISLKWMLLTGFSYLVGAVFYGA
ncbi:7776_t:CDS:2, partial [Dentiscutata heterogama]